MGGIKNFLMEIRGLAGADKIWMAQITHKRRLLNPIYLWAAAIVLLCVELCPFRVGMVMGRSMFPTLKPYQVFLIYHDIGDRYVPMQNDVVVFHHGGEVLVKRIRAVEGESVWLVDSSEATCYVPDSNVSRFRKMLKRYPKLGKLKKVNIPENKVFVMGDNTSASCDSRDFGPVDVKSIIGKVRISKRHNNSDAAYYGVL